MALLPLWNFSSIGGTIMRTFFKSSFVAFDILDLSDILKSKRKGRTNNMQREIRMKELLEILRSLTVIENDVSASDVLRCSDNGC